MACVYMCMCVSEWYNGKLTNHALLDMGLKMGQDPNFFSVRIKLLGACNCVNTESINEV